MYMRFVRHIPHTVVVLYSICTSFTIYTRVPCTCSVLQLWNTNNFWAHITKRVNEKEVYWYFPFLFVRHLNVIHNTVKLTERSEISNMYNTYLQFFKFQLGKISKGYSAGGEHRCRWDSFSFLSVNRSVWTHLISRGRKGSKVGETVVRKERGSVSLKIRSCG